MNFFKLLFCVSAILVSACNDQIEATPEQVEDRELQIIQESRLPRFESRVDSIKINWYTVSNAENYQLVWSKNRGAEQSFVTSETNHTIQTSGFEVFDVWVSALDQQGGVLQTTETVEVRSIDPSLSTVRFSDNAP
jgi:hypothetical protein